MSGRCPIHGPLSDGDHVCPDCPPDEERDDLEVWLDDRQLRLADIARDNPSLARRAARW